jgi:cell division protein FtsB
MREFQERQKVRHILASRPVLWAAGIIVLWLAVAVGREYLVLRAAERLRLASETERQAMEEKVAAVRGKIGELGSDAGLEKIVRERFNVKRPGEELIVIVDDKSASGTRAIVREQSFWASLVATLKNIF